MQNKERQIKNTFIYTLQAILSNLFPVITLSVFTRILTKEDYGYLALAYFYAFIVSGISNFGLIIAFERNYFEYKKQNKSEELLYSILLFVFTSFLFFACATYIFRNILSNWIISKYEYGNLLFLTFCAVSSLNLKNYFMIYFRCEEDSKSFFLYSINESIIDFILSVIFVVILRLGVIGIVWGKFLASIGILIYILFRLSRKYPFAFNREALMNALKLSTPLTPRIFFGVIGTQFDKYMIRLMSTIGGVGIYSIGQKISNVISVLTNAIQNVYAPQVYKKMFDQNTEIGESIGRYLTQFLYISILIAVGVSFFCEEVIILLTPASYHGATDIVIILSIYYGLLFFGKQPQLVFAKKTYIISILSFGSILLNIALNVPFIMKWGAIGAAWATLLSGTISGLVSFYIGQRHYYIKWEYKKTAAILFLFIFPSLVLILLRHFMVAYMVKLLIKLIFLVCYAYLGIKIKVITKDNYISIKKVILDNLANNKIKNINNI